MTHHFRASLLCLCVLLLTAMTNPQESAPDFLGYVTFGDSLSDPGNHYALFKKVAQSPFDQMNSAPYDIGGGFRFTNGPTWIEYLATDLNSKGPAFEMPKHFKNYAVGSARARSGSPVFSAYDLSTQVQAYLSDHNGQAAANTKFMLWIGANDITEALIQYASSSSRSYAIIDEAIRAIEKNIKELCSAGARNINLLNIPDLGLAPVVKSHGFLAEMVASSLSEDFNDKLAALTQELNSLSTSNMHCLINLIDIDALLQRHLEDNHLSLEPCISFDVFENAICQEPEKHLFWDGIHPTTEGHRLISEYVRTKV